MMRRASALRYRFALLAWPGQLRRESGCEMLATLAEGDAARGGASTREAVALLGAGLRVRVRHEGADAALVLGGLLVLAAAVAPPTTWMGSEIVFPDGTRSSGSQLQAWPVREALMFLAPLAVGRLRAATVVVVILAPAVAWLAAGVTPHGGIDYPLARDNLIEALGVGLAAAVPTAIVVFSVRRRGEAGRRRVTAVVVAGCALAGLPGSIDRGPLGEGGVAYGHSWMHDVGIAVPVVLLGIILLLLALLAPAPARSQPSSA